MDNDQDILEFGNYKFSIEELGGMIKLTSMKPLSDDITIRGAIRFGDQFITTHYNSLKLCVNGKPHYRIDTSVLFTALEIPN
jgi:hypothetical protein